MWTLDSKAPEARLIRNDGGGGGFSEENVCSGGCPENLRKMLLSGDSYNDELLILERTAKILRTGSR